MYDGIYNAGMNNHADNATNWTNLVDSASAPINPSETTNNEWTANGLQMRGATESVTLPVVNPEGEGTERYTFANGLSVEMAWTPDPDNFAGHKNGDDYVYTLTRKNSR